MVESDRLTKGPCCIYVYRTSDNRWSIYCVNKQLFIKARTNGRRSPHH